MNTLFTRLSLVLLLIVCTMGAALYFVARANSQAYYDELSQRLNAPIAMYVTEQRQLIEDGVANLTSLQELAAHAMVINPTSEIYLLDETGAILGHNLPNETTISKRVDLAPIRALIDGENRFPLYGGDPRSADSKKVFSAWPVTSDNGLEGYLYVVLGGQTYETLAGEISDAYSARSSLIVMASITVLTAIIGLIVFFLLTGRLNRLNREVQRVTQSQFQVLPALENTNSNGDEIDQLTNAFADMSAQIKRQLSQLTENDRLRRELISNISHDLRTPLAAMQGYIETLIVKNQSLTTNEQDQYLQAAQKHARRLSGLIDDLFELSKLDATTAPPNLEAFSMAELVQDIAQEFKIASERKNINIEVEVDERIPMTIGDIGMIHRALENLVKNAVHAVPQGGLVTITINERINAVSVAVADNGPGIAEADVSRIFDRFYRTQNGEEAQADSSGLGLAIVKRILDLHEAEISVASQPNLGARFEFELPCVQQAA